MADYLLAIDQGTTSTRAIVFDAALVPIATAQQEISQIYPAPGLVEHDPEEIFRVSVSAMAEAEPAKAPAGVIIGATGGGTANNAVRPARTAP